MQQLHIESISDLIPVYIFPRHFDNHYLRSNLLAGTPYTYSLPIPRISFLRLPRRLAIHRPDVATLASRHRYSLAHGNGCFPRMQCAVQRWSSAGPNCDCGGTVKSGENGRRDARRRAPTILDSGQRPRCLSGEMAVKGN